MSLSDLSGGRPLHFVTSTGLYGLLSFLSILPKTALSVRLRTSLFSFQRTGLESSSILRTGLMRLMRRSVSLRSLKMKKAGRCPQPHLKNARKFKKIGHGSLNNRRQKRRRSFPK
ncbi:hypothetical protein DL96DRAFT_1623426 [Flagelloscypha sp. PMI_526]|nr:hypothetical protein DL96DRAFT_1623426 [Flagelloscypha sp. PMI_526]